MIEGYRGSWADGDGCWQTNYNTVLDIDSWGEVSNLSNCSVRIPDAQLRQQSAGVKSYQNELNDFMTRTEPLVASIIVYIYICI